MTTNTYQGLLYVKHGRVGTRSEGPDYFLQTARGDYLLRHGERNPWEPDYQLEFFSRRMVAVTGALDEHVLSVESIQEILAPRLPTQGGPRELKLVVGHSAPLDGGQISFVKVVEDSRCPTGATCVWAGQAIVGMQATPTQEKADDFTLTLRADAEDGATRIVFGQRVTLLALDPHPNVAIRIDPRQYTISLRIEPL